MKIYYQYTKENYNLFVEKGEIIKPEDCFIKSVIIFYSFWDLPLGRMIKDLFIKNLFGYDNIIYKTSHRYFIGKKECRKRIYFLRYYDFVFWTKKEIIGNGKYKECTHYHIHLPILTLIKYLNDKKYKK